MQNYVQFIFYECFCTSRCVLSTNVKKSTILGKIVGLLKFVGEIQQQIRNHSPKNNFDLILDYILLPTYPLHFQKFCPIQKQ